MHPWDIRNQVINEEIDYVALKAILADYAYPRDKITQLLNTKTLIRVKKGLYVFGPKYARQLFSKEVLANLIYGPSAVSLEYALAFYQLIPERVTTVTSITTKRSKQFTTPVGSFNYHHLDLTKYDVGLVQMALDENHFFMIASREKALADYLLFRKPKLKFTNQDELLTYLQTQLRIDSSLLAKFDKSRMREIACIYQHATVNLLSDYLQQVSDE
jgi:predicted transcriptional regulator of viral defense system